MRYHSNLASIARRTGFPVSEVAGWQSRGDGGMADRPTGVVCHHTASGSATGDMPSLRILTSGRSDLQNSLCAFGLARSGRIYVVAAGESWHAGPVNDSRMSNYQAFGIEAENSGTGERWPAVQLESYARLCAELCRAFGIPPGAVRGHKEVCSPAGRKIDPAGIDMNAFRRVVTSRLVIATSTEDIVDAAQEDRIAIKSATQGWNRFRVTAPDGKELTLTEALETCLQQQAEILAKLPAADPV